MGILDTIISAYKTGMGLLAPTDKDLEMRAEFAKGLLGQAPVLGDAISGYDAIQSARQGNYGESALNAVGLLPFIPSIGGMIKQTGNFSKKLTVPTNLPGNVITPVLGSLPKSSLYDAAGNFVIDAAGSGSLRKLDSGDYLATLSPVWMSKSKPYFAIGDNPEELISNVQRVASNSDKSIKASRAAKIPKDVRSTLEQRFGKNFTYDISNAANSGSYYITHTPSGTKIRVSDHDLPRHYENTAQIDIRPDEISSLPDLLSGFLK